jgi:hypothetical protein
MIEGEKEAITKFLGLLDTFLFWFNTVTSQGSVINKGLKL